MSQVDFGETQNNAFSRAYQNPEEKGMVGLLIKWGVAKDAKVANIILLLLALAFFGVSIYLAVSFLIPPKAPVGQNGGIDDLLKGRVEQPK